MSRSKGCRELYCAFLDVTVERYSALSLSEAPTELSHDSAAFFVDDLALVVDDGDTRTTHLAIPS